MSKYVTHICGISFPVWLAVFRVCIPKRDAHIYVYTRSENSVTTMCLVLRCSAIILIFGNFCDCTQYPCYFESIHCYLRMFLYLFHSRYHLLSTFNLHSSCSHFSLYFIHFDRLQLLFYLGNIPTTKFASEFILYGLVYGNVNGL